MYTSVQRSQGIQRTQDVSERAETSSGSSSDAGLVSDCSFNYRPVLFVRADVGGFESVLIFGTGGRRICRAIRHECQADKTRKNDEQSRCFQPQWGAIGQPRARPWVEAAHGDKP